MNQLQVFENELFKVSAKSEGEQILFDVEQVAKSLGFVQAKNNREYIRWERVNEYLPQNSPVVGKGDLIPEPLVYKLAFKASNELAEKFQDWLAIEVIPSIRKTGSYQSGIDTSQLSPELQMFNGLYQSLAKQEMATKQLETKVDNISSIVSLSNVDWRKKTNAVLRKISDKWSGVEPYRSVKSYAYERLEERGACNLNVRLNNRKKNAASQGMTKSYVQKINKLDCIAEEKRLVEIYIQVVKEMAIQFRVDIRDLKDVI